MTKFVIGKAFEDVSAKLRNEACAAIGESSEPVKIIYIVPDQFEDETEKAVLRSLGSAGLSARAEELSVTTFAALSERIVRLCSEKRRPADDLTKNIIMQRVVLENKDRLNAFGFIAEKPGFSAKMVQTITMLKTAGITPADLSEESISEKIKAADTVGSRRAIKKNSVIADKLRDVGMLYLEYHTALSQNYIDKLDMTGAAAEEIENVDLFDDALVFVDGFNDFTNSQLHFLREVFKFAQDVTLGFNAELKADEERENVFLTIDGQIRRLYEDAAEIAGADAPVFVCDGIPAKTDSAALRELSDRIFGDTPCENKGEDCIDIVEAADIYEELDFVAAKIQELALDKGYRYSDIAVLLANPAQYKSGVRSVFSKYDIPYFADIPEPILHQPLVRLILALLRALNDFSVDSVLSYVKTGFLQRREVKEDGKERFIALTKGDINAFESFIFEWQVSAKQLKSPFEQAERANNAEKKTSADRMALTAEMVRSVVVEPLLRLKKSLSGKNGAEITKRIFEFLTEDIGIERAIQRRIRSEEDKSRNDSALVRSYQKLWDTVSGILDKLYSGLGTGSISLEDYAQIFRDICAGTTLAKPPQYIDNVLVGDIDRTRTGNVRAVFIVGALGDTFPSETVSEGVFSPFETEIIRENIIHITDNAKKEYCLKSAKEQYCLSLYRAYKAVSTPSDYLCISYHTISPSGDETRRSEAVTNILALLERDGAKKAADFGEAFYCRSAKAAKQRFSAGLYSNTDSHTALALALGETSPEFISLLNRLFSERAEGKEHSLSERTAQLLFPLNISATKVEKLSLCRFEFFCEIGLGIVQPMERTFNRAWRGNVVHFCMENVLKKYSGSMDEFFALDRARIRGEVREQLSEYQNAEMTKDFGDDRRIAFLYNNIETIATDILVMTQAEFSMRDYRPKFFELNLRADEGEHDIPDCAESGNAAVPEAQLFCENAQEEPQTIAETKTADSPSEPTRKPADKLSVKPLTLDVGGRNVNITGIIDRVDMFTDEKGDRYLRVVDYKTGTHEFSIPKALSGINVQMLLYLFALENANRTEEGKAAILPAEVSYTNAKVKRASDKMAAFEFLTEQHKQSGMLIDSPAVREEAEKFAKAVADKLYKECAEGAAPRRTDDSSLLSPEGYELFKKDCLDRITQNLSELFGGDIKAVPVKYRNEKTTMPCDYCRFKTICGRRKGECTFVDEKAPIIKYLAHEDAGKDSKEPKDKTKTEDKKGE